MLFDILSCNHWIVGSSLNIDHLSCSNWLFFNNFYSDWFLYLNDSLFDNFCCVLNFFLLCCVYWLFNKMVNFNFFIHWCNNINVFRNCDIFIFELMLSLYMILFDNINNNCWHNITLRTCGLSFSSLDDFSHEILLFSDFSTLLFVSFFHFLAVGNQIIGNHAFKVFNGLAQFLYLVTDWFWCSVTASLVITLDLYWVIFFLQCCIQITKLVFIFLLFCKESIHVSESSSLNVHSGLSLLVLRSNIAHAAI